ncbi:MAG: M56 family metallopeptidase [Candidatus Sulfotelmatobacter sp.]
MKLLIESGSALAFLIACSVKVTGLLVVVCFLAIALRNQSAALRHRAWAAGILSSLALPVFAPLLPAWHSAAFAGAGVWGPAGAMATQAKSGNFSAMIVNAIVVNAGAVSPLFGKLAVILLLIWVAGFFILALKLAGGLARLTRASAQARPLQQDDWLRLAAEFSQSLKVGRRVRVLQCSNPMAMPITWGVFRPVVILPASASDWPESRRRMVLLHELTHIARYDWFLQICAELARCFYWFHPLAWIAAGNLRHESERACDDSVLNSGVEASAYAAQLLDLARTLKNSSRTWATALAIARPSTLERRFIAMLNPSINRNKMSRGVGLFTVFAALCLLLPLAALRLPAQDLSGSFGGTVRDANGSGAKNATVIMTNDKSNTNVMTVSDADGNFTFKGLPAGEYEMKVVKPGFAVYRASGLEPSVESSQNITLEASAAGEGGNVLPRLEPGAKPPLSLDSGVEATKILSKVTPTYPAAAKAARTQGAVTLDAIIGVDGKVRALRVRNTDIDPDLARAAVESVSQWRYRPTLVNDEPIEIATTVVVNFTLMQ